MARTNRQQSPSGRTKRKSQPRKLSIPLLGIAALALVTVGLVGAVVLMTANGAAQPSTPPVTALPSSSSPAAASAPGASANVAASSGSHQVAGSVTVAGSAAPSPSLGDIQCESTEQVAYHVHAHLAIVVDGKAEVIPKGIGIGDLCLFWIHTHADSGIIHVEAPAPADFQLGQFFGVWGEPLDPGDVGPYTVPSGEHVFAFVDGQPWAADPRTIPLVDHAVIELQVGKTAIPPSSYQFPAGY